MSEPANNPTTGQPDRPHLPADGWFDPGPKNAQLIYILYFTSVVVGLTAVIGVIMAHMNRGKIGGYVDTHYTWLIRTFWIGLLFSFIAAILMFVGIGFLLLVAVLIWVVIRLVKGIQALGQGKSLADPQTWWI